MNMCPSSIALLDAGEAVDDNALLQEMAFPIAILDQAMHIQEEFTRELARRRAEKDAASHERELRKAEVEALRGQIREENDKEWQRKIEERVEAHRQRVQ